MASAPFNIADFGLDAASLAGSLAHKLDAIRAAGFSQLSLAATDLIDHPGGVDAALRLVSRSGLRVAALSALRDFEGLGGAPHAYKVGQAKELLALCAAVGARLLRVGSSSSPHASADRADCARDLRKLAMLAVPMGVRIGYEGLAEGCHVRDFGSAWDLVFQADVPNLGLVLDSFDVLSGALAAEEIEMLDPSKVFLVRLCDLLWPAAAPGTQVRVLPGEGSHRAALAALMRRLDRLGYRGDFSFAFDNADDRQLPPAGVAERGRRAALWLAEDVLQLSTPLPGRMRLHRR